MPILGDEERHNIPIDDALDESIKEFIRTEETFLRRVSYLVEKVQPALTGNLPATHEAIIFGQINDLREVSKKLIQTSASLGPALAFTSLSRAIRAVFGDHCAKHERAIEIVMGLSVDLIREYRLDGLDLPSLLLEPIQRIARYPLLFRSIYERTADLQCQKALSLAENILRSVNELIRSEEHCQQLQSLNDRLVWPASICPVNLTGPCRNSLPRKLLGQALAKLNQSHRCRLMIFNDFILLTDPPGNNVIQGPWAVWQTLALLDQKHSKKQAKQFEFIVQEESFSLELLHNENEEGLINSVDVLISVINRAAECYIPRIENSEDEGDVDKKHISHIYEATVNILQVDFSTFAPSPLFDFYYTAVLKTCKYRSERSKRAQWRNELKARLNVVSLSQEQLKLSLWQVKRFEPDVAIHSISLKLDSDVKNPNVDFMVLPWTD